MEAGPKTTLRSFFTRRAKSTKPDSFTLKNVPPLLRTIGATIGNIPGKGKGTGVIKICAGSATGTVIGYINLDGSGDESTLMAKESVTGTKDLYLIASADVELDYWFFS